MKTFEIKNPYIAQDLMQHGFVVKNTINGVLTMEAPNDISASKARKYVSISIKLFETAKLLNKFKAKYDNLVNEINELNQNRQ